MNRNRSRLVWNRRLGAPQVAPESAHAHACDGASSSQATTVSRPASLPLARAVAAALFALGASPASAVPIPSDYVVTSATDSGNPSIPGSLSWAIAQANSASTGSVTIVEIDSSISTLSINGTLPLITTPIGIIGTAPLQIGGVLNATSMLGLLGANSAIIEATVGNIGMPTGANGNDGTGWSANGGSGSNGSYSALAGAYFKASTTGTLTGAGGGNGGNGAAAGSSETAGHGGAGGNGSGSVVGEDFTVINTGNLLGGAGGNGGNGGNGSNGGTIATALGGSGGIGRSGGNGVDGQGFNLTNNGIISGGASGAGGNGGTGGNGAQGLVGLDGQYAGTGGGGGYGSRGGAGGNASWGGYGVVGDDFTLTNTGTITGGHGGNGGNGGAGGNGAAGGNGGNSDDPVAGYSGYGGTGGRGGDGGNGGAGGGGGYGVGGSHFTLNNSGTITGGNGGAGGTGGTAGLAGSGGNAGTGGYFGALDGADGAAGTAGTTGASGQGGIGVASWGDSTIRNSGTIAGGLANDGAGARANAIELWDGGNTLILEAGSTIIGNVVSYDGGDTLALGGDVNAPNGNTFALNSIGAQFQGFDNFVKEGSSTWTLTGSDTYSQDWRVEAGRLNLADNAYLDGAVTIASGASFGIGHQAVVDNSVTGSGTLIVGSSTTPYASASINGDYIQSSDSTLRISAHSVTEYGSLAVDGNATLAGTLDIDVRSGAQFAEGAGLTSILTVDGNLAGTFREVTDNSLLFDFTASYNAHSVDLTVTAAGPGASAEESVRGHGFRQAASAARVLDHVFQNDPNSALTPYFIPLTSGDEVANAVNEVLPLFGGSSANASGALNGVNNVINTRQSANLGRASGDAFFGNRQVWVKPFGSWADQDERKGAFGYKSSLSGIAFGVDAEVGEQWQVGAAFVYADARLKNRGGAPRQRLDTEVYQLVGYGSYRLSDATALSFQADFGRNDNDGKRDISFAGLQAKADYASWTAHLGAALSHTLELDAATRFTPSVRADYTWIKDESYTEKGAAALGLHVKSRDTEAFVLGVDGEVGHKLAERTTLSANLGVGYDLINERNSITATFAGAPGAAFTTKGIDASPWLVRGGLGVSHATGKGVALSLRYDVEHREDFLNQTASARLSWAF